MKSLALVLGLVSLASACAGPPEQRPRRAPADAQPAAASKSDAAIQWKGVLVPAERTAVALWPEAYKGELFVLQAAPHGSSVKSGDVVLELEARSIDEQFESAERDVRTASIKHEALVQRGAIAEEEEREQLDKARSALDRAQRRHEGYMQHELEFSRRRDELVARREQSYVDDQTDELEQLRAMYEADELTDATEEIVLKRSERDLELSKYSNALSADRRRYNEELQLKLQQEERLEGLRSQEASLERMVRKQEITRRERADAEARSAAELAKKRLRLERLRKDRELMTVRAPRDGVLLHGKADDYRPGGKSARIERGSKLAPRTDVMLVAVPGSFGVALDVKESELATARETGVVSVTPVSLPDEKLAGALAVESVPAGSAGEESTFRGTVRLDGRVAGLFFGMHVEVTPGARE